MNPLTLDRLTEAGAHQRGHFLLSSGLHSADYLQCALYLAEPHRAGETGQLLAARLGEAGLQPTSVVAPALGGLIIGHETARALGTPFLFAEREQGLMVLRRGFTVTPADRVVVVEDVVTTGRSTREVIALLEDAGATVLGVASLVNRSASANPFEPLSYHALLAASFPTWTQDECPLCRAAQPITKPGSRAIR